MKYSIPRISLILWFSFTTIFAQPRGFVTVDRQKSGRYADDPLTVKSLNPAYDIFPDASLVDFSYLLDPPAGKHGFVKVTTDGRLQFENGKPARFWGVVIDQQSLNIPKYMIDMVLEALARAGVNMIRLRSLDGRISAKAGLIQQNIFDEGVPNQTVSRYFDTDFRDRVDYWIGAAKKKGMYAYVGFRSYRIFKGEDGVANADSLEQGGRMYAIFNQRLIELQKEYIDSLAIYHINPYTGLSYAQDPTIVTFELSNEDDLLSRPDVWSKMPQPYWNEFNLLWNNWLRERYKSTAGLKAAWTNSAGITALSSLESIEKRNIRLPSMENLSFEQAMLAPYHDPLRSPARRMDAVRFAMSVQEKYFKQLSEHCRERGIRVPLNAIVRTDLRPMTATAAKNLDMISGDTYFDVPSFLQDKTVEYYSNNNYFTENSSAGFAPAVAQYHWSDRPAAVREWSTSWPNIFRGSSVLETAAYSLFQGIDIVTYSDYTTAGNVTSISTFGLQADPVRWGMFSLAAKMFLGGDVQQAQRTVGIIFSEEDISTYSSYESPLYQLAWMHRVINITDEDAKEKPLDFFITAGRSHRTQFRGDNGLIYALTPYVGTQRQQIGNERNSLYARSGYPLSITILKNDTIFSSLGGSLLQIPTRWGFKMSEIQNHGFLPVGNNRAKTFSAGFRDTVRNVLGLGGVSESQVLPFAIGMLNDTYKTPMSVELFDQKIYQTDTGELTRNSALGYMTISAKNFCALQGALTVGEKYEAGVFSVVSQSPVAVIAATSLDNKPLGESSLFVVKMVTAAENFGQALDTVAMPGFGKRVVVCSRGDFPVVTKGVATEKPTSIWLNGKKLADVYLQNGTWEIVFDLSAKQYELYCDTPNIRFDLFPDQPRQSLKMTRYLYGRESLGPQIVESSFVYPGYSKYVKLEE